jgi:hypothetical protein
VAKRASQPGRWRRALAWITACVANEAQSVPAALRACEFDCDEPDCSAERWAGCQRRIGRRRSAFAAPPTSTRAGG